MAKEMFVVVENHHFQGFKKNVKGLILVDTTCKLYIIPGNLLE